MPKCGESAAQQGLQPLRHRLIEHVIVKRMQQVLTVILAGEKIANVTVDRRFCNDGLDVAAFGGEEHWDYVSCGWRASFVAIPGRSGGLGHWRISLMTKR